MKMFQKSAVTCMYCKKPILNGPGSNPADFGLHYTDKDVYGQKSTCAFCDRAVTQTNRMLALAVESYRQENRDETIYRLHEAMRNIKDLLTDIENLDE